MFDYVTIHLNSPICKCSSKHLSWGIYWDQKKHPGLQLRCKECDVELRVPNAEFGAVFDIKRPNPVPKKIEKPEYLDDEQKVISFPGGTGKDKE